MSIYKTDVKKDSVINSLFWTTGLKALAQVITLVTTIVLARFITATDFGLMAMAIVYMGLIDVVRDFGILSAIIQRKDISSTALSTCFWFLTAASILLLGGTIIFSPVIAVFFSAEQLTSIIILLGFAFLCVPSQIIARGILTRNLRLDIIAKAELSTAILRFTIAITFAVNGSGVWSLVYAYLSEKFALALLLPFLAGWHPRWTYSYVEVKPLLNFGGNVIASRMLWYLYSKLDFVIIGRLLGSEVLGIYSIASQIARSFLQFASTAIYHVIYPVFSSYQDSYFKLRNVFLKASMFLTTLTIPLFLGLAAIAPNFVPLFLGSEWQEAIYPLQVLSITAAMQVTAGLGPLLLDAIGKPKLNVYLNLFSLFIMCIGFYIGATWMGLNGILLAWLALTPIRSFVIIYTSANNIQLSIFQYMKKYFRSLLPGILMFIIVISINKLELSWSSEVRLGILVVSGVISYLLLQFTINREVYLEIINLLNKKLLKPILK